MATTQRTSQTANESTQGFDQMAVGLKHAAKELQENPQESIAAVLAMFKPIGEYVSSAWSTTSSYARRHPVRIAVTAVAIGLLASRLMKSDAAKNLH